MEIPDSVLLAPAYCGPVHYFVQIAGYGKVYLEQHENYIRQTYRNRCVILGSNGPLPLTIPVEHGRSPGVKIRDIRIVWYEKWQVNHWKAISSAYNNSPFFGYYCDDLRPFYEKKREFLFDFNRELTEKIMELAGLEKELYLTEAFERVPGRFANLREVISPKAKVTDMGPVSREIPYTQVFEGKFPFIPQLSILDLLFNAGPETVDILLRSFTGGGGH